MMGTAVPPASASATPLSGQTGVAGQQKMSASFANFFRIAAVAERLALQLRSGNIVSSNSEFIGLCLSLSRGIDYAVANNEIPPRAQDLPLLLKQVCQHQSDLFLQGAIMVLMISVTNASKMGWFLPKDSQELLAIANEIGNSFCSPGDVNSASTDSFSIISTVMSRFYPFMKIGHILASLEVKPGYGTYVVDFHISKNTIHSPQDRIRLFVAQRDDIETSACIISPQQVSFLLNGRGVERRTNVSMDPGPQLPTNVTGILKYGTNLLQAVGQFNGPYIVAVAFMSVTPLPDTPELPDYVQASVTTADLDDEVIEGPSRVSLNCPISYTRIRTPIKGQSCKHLQCFDFSNYININSRRPAWRCPHCNQPIFYPKIRVDRNMVKVLKEVGDNVSNVIISADGSWNAVMDSDDSSDQTQKEVVDCQQDMPELQEPSNIVDLTEDDDRMDVDSLTDVEDRKPSPATLQNQPVTTNLTTPSQLSNANAVGQNVASQAGNSFWSDMYFSVVSGSSSTGSALQLINGIRASTPMNSLESHVITDAISPSLNRDVGGQVDNSISSSMQRQIRLANEAANASINNEYGWGRRMTRQVNRTAFAVQALPALPQTPPVQPQRSRTNSNTAVVNGSSVSQAALPLTSTSSGTNMAVNHPNMHQQYPRSHISPIQGSSSLQHPLSMQRPFNMGQPVQHGVRLPTSNQLSGHSASSGLRNDSPNLLQHQAIRMPQSGSVSPSLGRSSSFPTWSQTQQRVGNTAGVPNSQQTRFAAAAQRRVQVARQPPLVPVQIPAPGGGASYSSVDTTRSPAMVQRGNVGELQLNSGTNAAMDSSEVNWQPTGRMRGSLSSQAASALKDLVILPTQPTQSPQTPSNCTPSPTTNVSPQLEAFLSNRRNLYSQTQNSASTQPATTSGNS